MGTAKGSVLLFGGRNQELFVKVGKISQPSGDVEETVVWQPGVKEQKEIETWHLAYRWHLKPQKWMSSLRK